MRRGTRGRYCRCWSSGFAKRGRGCASCCGGTRRSVGAGCSIGASAIIVGLARNAVLERKVEVACEGAERGFQATGRKCRVFAEVRYGAGAWHRPRRVIARIEHGPKGRNPRFIVTNLDGQAKALYERVYCQRGEMENRIKEQQLDLFADRTSSPRWWTDQYRVTLAALAYTLLETMRRHRTVGHGPCPSAMPNPATAACEARRSGDPKHPHRGREAVEHLPRPSVVPAPGAPAHCRIAHGERVVAENGVPGSPRIGALRPRVPPRIESALPRPYQLLRSALRGHLRPIPVRNMRREMPHYVQKLPLRAISGLAGGGPGP